MNRILVAVCYLLFSCQLFSQAPDKVGNLSPKGKVFTYVSPTFSPSNLKELARHSQFIIEGKVAMALPSRYSDPQTKSGYIETDYEVAITRILKGPKNDGIDKAIVSQTGGTIGEVESEVAGDPPMQLGETYILFLTYDDRPGLLKYKKTRWIPIGDCNGKFKVENGRIRVSPKSQFFGQPPVDLSSPGPEGMRADDFVRDLGNVLNK